MRAPQLLSLLSLVVCSSLVCAQDLTVRPGTRFPAELTHTLKTSTAKVGDPVLFRTLEPVLLGNRVVAPEGSELRGEITEVREQEESGEAPEISIRLSTLLYKHKRVPINLVVSSLYYSRSAVADSYDTGRMKVTFLEGIHVVAHVSDEASTSFVGRGKNVVLHSGIL